MLFKLLPTQHSPADEDLVATTTLRHRTDSEGSQGSVKEEVFTSLLEAEEQAIVRSSALIQIKRALFELKETFPNCLQAPEGQKGKVTINQSEVTEDVVRAIILPSQAEDGRPLPPEILQRNQELYNTYFDENAMGEPDFSFFGNLVKYQMDQIKFRTNGTTSVRLYRPQGSHHELINLGRTSPTSPPGSPVIRKKQAGTLGKAGKATESLFRQRLRKRAAKAALALSEMNGTSSDGSGSEDEH
jgi:hypothetical protein